MRTDNFDKEDFNVPRARQPISKAAVDKIKELEIGGEYSYKELCRELGLPVKGGCSKIAQLDEIQKYCELERIEGTQRYAVNRIYDSVILELVEKMDAPEQQLLFDAALYQEFLKHPDEPLYLSNTEMLKLFQEVNENFAFTFNKQNLTGDYKRFDYMHDMSQIVYRILHQWTARRLESMNRRHIIMQRYGFRLYTTMRNAAGGTYRVGKNVEVGSDIERRCQMVWNKALDAVQCDDYRLGQTEVTWMPEAVWLKFEKKLAELTKAEFASDDGGYDDMRVISILWPMSQDWLRETIKIIYERVGNPALINRSAIRKISETSQLDDICTFSQREEFIKYNMWQNPPVWFKRNKKE